ncbi:MAG: hypothetical protein LBJ41_01765 [Treponema sp.]|jgi:hypothetical protein|nr:hypothetical protein [Treponema sp.]
MDAEKLKEIIARHQLWLASVGWDRADLRGADLDYSCLPLWCGGLQWQVDVRIAAQLAYHLCSMDCDDPEFIKVRNNLLDFANKFHRAQECGSLREINGDKAI